MNLLRRDCVLGSKQHAYPLFILGLEIGFFYQIIQNVTWHHPKSEKNTKIFYTSVLPSANHKKNVKRAKKLPHSCTVWKLSKESLLTSYSAKKLMLLLKHALRITGLKSKTKEKPEEMTHFYWSGPSNTTSSTADLSSHCLASEYIIPAKEKTEQRVEENNTYTKQIFPHAT